MNKRIKLAAGLTALLGLSAPAVDAHACSPTQTEVYKSAKSAWCVENEIVNKFGPFPKPFFAYGDSVVDQLVAVFDVPAEGLYTFEASKETGGAHTGSECCGLGVTVTGDAFYNDGYGATGFWGYLLSLHEMINDFTGQVSSGWPTDFWADHISAFPNSMDWHIMETLGTKDSNTNLLKASAAQKKRFYPGGDSVDARVGMFDQIYDLPNYGYPGLSRVFGFVKGDKLSWDGLGVPNADVKRTEYVMAYLSLGAGKPVTPIMQAAHVGDGTPGSMQDQGYVVSEANIDAIATAHCAILAAGSQGVDVTADKKALRSGNYSGVTAKGTCGAGCPAECGCKLSTNACVAPWLGDPIMSGAGGAGGSGGGASATATATSTTAAGSGGAGGSGGSGSSGDPSSAGCSCHVGGDSPDDTSFASLLAASAFAALAIARARSRKR
jgi:hypothetical protein